MYLFFLVLQWAVGTVNTGPSPVHLNAQSPLGQITDRLSNCTFWCVKEEEKWLKTCRSIGHRKLSQMGLCAHVCAYNGGNICLGNSVSFHPTFSSCKTHVEIYIIVASRHEHSAFILLLITLTIDSVDPGRRKGDRAVSEAGSYSVVCKTKRKYIFTLAFKWTLQ